MTVAKYTGTIVDGCIPCPLCVCATESGEAHSEAVTPETPYKEVCHILRKQEDTVALNR